MDDATLTKQMTALNWTEGRGLGVAAALASDTSATIPTPPDSVVPPSVATEIEEPPAAAEPPSPEPEPTGADVPDFAGRLTQLALDNDRAKLLAEIVHLVVTDPPLPMDALAYVKEAALKARAGTPLVTSGSVEWPVELSSAHSPPPVEALPRRREVNTLRAEKIRAAQNRGVEVPWSIGSQLAAPHPPLALGHRNAPNFTVHATNVQSMRDKTGPFHSEPNATLDFRFDPSNDAKPRPNFGRNTHSRRRW